METDRYEWVYHKYQLTQTQWVESWTLYRTYWCPEIKSFVSEKIPGSEKDRRIIEQNNK